MDAPDADLSDVNLLLDPALPVPGDDVVGIGREELDLPPVELEGGGQVVPVEGIGQEDRIRYGRGHRHRHRPRSRCRCFLVIRGGIRLITTIRSGGRFPPETEQDTRPADIVGACVLLVLLGGIAFALLLPWGDFRTGDSISGGGSDLIGEFGTPRDTAVISGTARAALGPKGRHGSSEVLG